MKKYTIIGYTDTTKIMFISPDLPSDELNEIYDHYYQNYIHLLGVLSQIEVLDLME